MKRRTLLQGVLAFVGLSRFVQTKPDRIANQHSKTKSHMDAMAEALEADLWGQPRTDSNPNPYGLSYWNKQQGAS